MKKYSKLQLLAPSLVVIAMAFILLNTVLNFIYYLLAFVVLISALIQMNYFYIKLLNEYNSEKKAE